MNERLIHGNEKTFFVISVIISILVYLMLIISIVGIPYLLIGLLVSFFINGFFIASIRNNGVKITENQFPKIAQRVKELSADMGIQKVPDVYMIQTGGLLNAFATRFFGRHYVVLYSDMVEIIDDNNDEELDFIIAHELAHIKRNHLMKNLLILPAMWTPFLGKAYSRACEFTCDRMATVFIGNSKAAINSIAILASGRILYKQMNVQEYIDQHQKERGFFIWLEEVLSTHPPLPIRIKEIQYLREYPEYFGVTYADFVKETV